MNHVQTGFQKAICQERRKPSDLQREHKSTLSHEHHPITRVPFLGTTSARTQPKHQRSRQHRTNPNQTGARSRVLALDRAALWRRTASPRASTRGSWTAAPSRCPWRRPPAARRGSRRVTHGGRGRWRAEARGGQGTRMRMQRRKKTNQWICVINIQQTIIFLGGPILTYPSLTEKRDAATTKGGDRWRTAPSRGAPGEVGEDHRGRLRAGGECRSRASSPGWSGKRLARHDSPNASRGSLLCVPRVPSEKRRPSFSPLQLTSGLSHQ